MEILLPGPRAGCSRSSLGAWRGGRCPVLEPWYLGMSACPGHILLSWFRRSLQLLAGAVVRNGKALGNVAPCAWLLVPVLWGRVSDPLIREPAFSE